MKKWQAAGLFALVSLFQPAMAGWDPLVIGGRHTVTIQANGGSLSYSEQRSNPGSLANVAQSLRAVPSQMESALNSFMYNAAVSNGVNYQGGQLTGDLRLQISPLGGGLMRTTLGDVRFDARTQFSGRKWGIISYSCVSYLSLNNISVGASYNASNGQVATSSILLDAQPSSHTDCDSNLSWILPVVGNFIIRQVEGQIDATVLAGLRDTLTRSTQTLFYGQDHLQLTGLTRLISVDREVTLPNGQRFPIGQYVHNNLAYLLSSAEMTLQLGRGPVIPETDWSSIQPSIDSVDGGYLSLQISVPGLTLGLSLREQVDLTWQWNGLCGPNSASTGQVCHIP